MKRWFRGLTRVRTFLLLTIQPCTWLTALQKQLIRGSVFDTTLFSTKQSETASLPKRDIRHSFLRQTLFIFIGTNKITGRKGKHNDNDMTVGGKMAVISIFQEIQHVLVSYI